MLQMMLATLREGVEAFLIVAIIAAVLRKTGRHVLVQAVAWGTACAVVLSCGLGVFLSQWAVVPLNEGLLALVAAALVLSMVAMMARASRTLRAEIGARVDAAAARPGIAAWIGVFALTLLMVTREGMELAFVTAALAANEGGAALAAGALAGILLAAGLAAAWARYGHRVPLGPFFQATSIFLVLFAIQLVFYAFHEFTEAGVVPWIDNAYWHASTESLAEGDAAQIVTAALVLVPLAWVARASARRRPVRPRPTS